MSPRLSSFPASFALFYLPFSSSDSDVRESFLTFPTYSSFCSHILFKLLVDSTASLFPRFFPLLSLPFFLLIALQKAPDFGRMWKGQFHFWEWFRPSSVMFLMERTQFNQTSPESDWKALNQKQNFLKTYHKSVKILRHKWFSIDFWGIQWHERLLCWKEPSWPRWSSWLPE